MFNETFSVIFKQSATVFRYNFCHFKIDLSGNTVWPQTTGIQNSPKWTIFGIFNELCLLLNVKVARFARNVQWDFFCNFQALIEKIWLTIHPLLPQFYKFWLNKALWIWKCRIWRQKSPGFVRDDVFKSLCESLLS